MTRRFRVYDERTGKIAGCLERDEGQEALHWVAYRRNSRKWSALGVSFASVWSSFAEFSAACNAPVSIQF